MLLSVDQNTAASKHCHQKSSSVNHWWVMNSLSCKTPETPSSILRTCSGIIIKFGRINLNLQSLQFVLNLSPGFTSISPGASPNKSINADCQSDAVFLIARCAAGYLKR